MSYTSADLLTSINRRTFAPTGQTTYSTSDILEIADEELRTLILPEILSVREEFFVHYVDVALVADQQRYEIPDRSIGMTIREIKLYDAGGNVTDLTRIEPEDVDHISQTEALPSRFYLENNQIVIYRTPSSANGTLRIQFYLRPNDLVEVADAAVVSAINTTTKVVSVASIPSAWATGDIYDLIKKDGGQECLDYDLTSTLVSGTDITFGSLPSRLSVGDYVSLQGTSPLVQLPSDFRPVLAQAVAFFIIDNMNIAGADKAKYKLDKMMASAVDMVVPRTIGSPRVILPPMWI